MTWAWVVQNVVGEEVDESESEAETIADGMLPPQDALQQHHEDLEAAANDESGSEDTADYDGYNAASSGIEEMDDEGEMEESEEEGAPEPMSSAPEGGLLGRAKQYHLSNEWNELVDISNKHGYDYTKLPAVVGGGIHRHPSGSFWSTRFPDEAWTTCRWNETRTPFQAMLRVIRHFIKLYIRGAPADMHAWKAHLGHLEKLDA